MFEKRHLDAISEVFGIDPILDFESLKGCGICFKALDYYKGGASGGKPKVAYEVTIDTTITSSVLLKFFVNPDSVTGNRDSEIIYFELASSMFLGFKIKGIGFDMQDKKLMLFTLQEWFEDYES